jgi:anti-anti-sigma factor
MPVFIPILAGRLIMAKENEITVQTHGPVILFAIQGDVTTASEPFFNEAYRNAEIGKTSKILLKFDENAYINSGGIAVLLQLLEETNRNKQQIGITGLSEHFKKIFLMVGITKFAPIYSSVDEALEVLSGS